MFKISFQRLFRKFTIQSTSGIPVGDRSIRLLGSTVCQLRCPECRNTLGITERNIGSGFLSAANFRTLIDQNPQIAHIDLSGAGEMFLNPELCEIMEYAYLKNVVLTAAAGVNLNTVEEKVLEGLVKYNFFALNCSIDGASQDTYGIYRRDGSFEGVIRNIQLINTYKKKYRSMFPILKWQFIRFGHNEQDIMAARKLAKDLGMSFFIRKNVKEGYSPVNDKEEVLREMNKTVTSREFYRNNKKGFRWRCGQIWNSLQINWDGRVLGCCKNQTGDFGNVFDQGLVSVLYGARLEYTRRMLMGKAETLDDIPCVMCQVYKQMKADDDWITKRDVWLFRMKSQYIVYRVIHRLGWKRQGIFFRLIIWSWLRLSRCPAFDFIRVPRF